MQSHHEHVSVDQSLRRHLSGSQQSGARICCQGAIFRMIVRYEGLQFRLQFSPGRTHLQTYAVECDLRGGLRRTNAYPPWSIF
jgi:hypothetical protein